MNLPIVAIPADLDELCKPYQPVFSKPQFQQFERFIAALMVSNEYNIEALHEGYKMSQTYDRLHHFVSESPWDVNDVLNRTVSVIKALPKDRTFSQDGTLVIDDSLIEKFGKMMEGVGKLYDHCDGRYLPYAHCLVGLIYADRKGKRYPLLFELYRKEDDCAKEGIPFRTKIVIAKSMVSWAVERGVPFSTVAFDSWFFCKELVDHIEGLGKDWITTSKSDRIITVDGKHASLKDFARTLSGADLSDVAIEWAKGHEMSYRIKSLAVAFPSLKREHERVRLVVSYEKDSLNGTLPTPVFLVSNRKDLRPERLIRMYRIRWSIETFFRDSKGELGLGEYQMRRLIGIEHHWCLVFTSAVLLELVRGKECSKKGIARTDLSVGSLRQRAWGRSLRSVIGWAFAQHAQGVPVEAVYATLGV